MIGAAQRPVARLDDPVRLMSSTSTGGGVAVASAQPGKHAAAVRLAAAWTMLEHRPNRRFPVPDAAVGRRGQEGCAPMCPKRDDAGIGDHPRLVHQELGCNGVADHLEMREGVMHERHRCRFLAEHRRPVRRQRQHDGVEQHGRAAGELEIGPDQAAIAALGAADLGRDDLQLRAQLHRRRLQRRHQLRVGETYAYEFTLRQHGTQMYHPHDDEKLQIALDMMGMFIIHPKDLDEGRVDRDFAWMTHAWKIDPGTSRPNPAEMTDFNIWSLNGRIFPGTLPMVVKTGQRVRIRVGNLSMVEHPMHLHGHHFEVSGTDGGLISPERRWRESTVQVPVGTTRDIEFVADNPGDWACHCHKSHHTMNAMSHSFPNMVGVNQGAAASDISRLVPGYMPMGKAGMAEMQSMSGIMPVPGNTTPMMAGRGPYGSMGMGGMFTTLKVRDQLASYDDPGWYRAPAGTVSWKVS